MAMNWMGILQILINTGYGIFIVPAVYITVNALKAAKILKTPLQKIVGAIFLGALFTAVYQTAYTYFNAVGTEAEKWQLVLLALQQTDCLITAATSGGMSVFLYEAIEKVMLREILACPETSKVYKILKDIIGLPKAVAITVASLFLATIANGGKISVGGLLQTVVPEDKLQKAIQYIAPLFDEDVEAITAAVKVAAEKLPVEVSNVAVVVQINPQSVINPQAIRKQGDNTEYRDT